MKMIKTATRPVQKRTVESESPKMNREEAKIRVALTKNITKPAHTIKTDTIFYKHEAGRVNFWVKLNDSNNYDIISYYFSYDNLQIKLFDDYSTVALPEGMPKDVFQHLQVILLPRYVFLAYLLKG
jgi:hypothetical protein